MTARRILLALPPALALVLALSACASRAAAPAGGPAATVAVPAFAGGGLEEQASWLKGSAAKLTPITGAAKWLGSPDFEAYRDESGAECIYDRASNKVLTWEPGVRTVSAAATDTYRPDGYDVTVGAAAQKADAKARTEYRGGDLASMRRVAQFADRGGGPQFEFSYDRYVQGIRVPDHVTVTSDGHTGSAGFVAHFTKPSSVAKGYAVGIDLPTAAAGAARAAKLTQWRFLAAELYVAPALGASKEHVVWSITLQDTSTPAEGVVRMDGDTRLVLVDPADGAASEQAVGGSEAVETTGQ